MKAIKFIFIFCLTIIFCHAQEEEFYKQTKFMTIEELLNVQITTASNSSERLSDAPATVLVITKDQIKERGYTDLVELFNDLPSIDFAATYGDLYYKSYWRGFRKGQGSAFILMLDGLIMNHLWFNWTDILVAFPISNIERVEVVYGPASSVYGPNAMMGVVNVITKRNILKNGTQFSANINLGSFENRIVDLNLFYKKDDFRVSATGFINHGDIDKNSLTSYEYTNPKYLSDKTLWGGFLDNNNIAGLATSPRKVRSFQLITFLNNIELGVHYYRVGDMYGLNYAFDKMQIQPIWIEEDYNLYLRTNYDLSKNVSGKSLLRFRRSDVPNHSNSLEGWGSFGTERTVTFGYWQSLNSSWSFFQDFDVKFNNWISFITGIKYEQKDLQKAYDLNYGPDLNPDLIDLNNYTYPTPPVAAKRNENRITWADQGIYLQSKFNISKILNSKMKHLLYLGIRFDDNSVYGNNLTFRAGYVGNYSNFRLKVLYGEAIQEPTPRELYGGWAGTGSAPDLIAEKSKTLEAIFSYTQDIYSVTFNPYRIFINNALANINGIPSNLGKRDIWGLDIHAIMNYKFSQNTNIKLWLYYTYIATEEKKFNTNGVYNGSDIIGDIADHKILFGITFTLKQLIANLKGRFISDRETVDSNPIKKVDSFFTADLNLICKNIISSGFDLNIKISNLFDKSYFHPGIRDANAGNSAGYWKNGKWFGSRGWSNSLLPQPGRSFLFGISIKL